MHSVIFDRNDSENDVDWILLFAGYDFTGRHSSVNSAPVIVDTTPPEKSSKEITMKSRFITELSHIEAW